MISLQVFSSLDELKYFKEVKQGAYRCLFFKHPINRTFDICEGELDGVTYEESIITDGDITLGKMNYHRPIIIWQNKVLTLDEGLSIAITLENATFFINKIKINDMVGYDIHTEYESEELLTKIIEYIYKGKTDFFDTSSISLEYPYTVKIEKSKDGNKTINYIDYSPSKKKKIKNKQKNC